MDGPNEDVVWAPLWWARPIRTPNCSQYFFIGNWRNRCNNVKRCNSVRRTRKNISSICWLGKNNDLRRKIYTVVVLLIIGTYCVLDFQYPQNHEVGLTIIHYLSFENNCTEILKPFNNTLEEYNKYKLSG